MRKPFTQKESEATELSDLAEKNNLCLMVAYRLHFDPSNLKAAQIVQSGKIGEPRYFNSIFSFSIKDPEDIRMKKETGGGPLWDIGIYCLNAARSLFRAEPAEVFAFGSRMNAKLFKEVDETVSACLKFPNGELASFTISFGSTDAAVFDVYGTTGSIRLEEAYEYDADRTLLIKTKSSKKKRSFKNQTSLAPS